MVFNSAMILAGLLTLLASIGLQNVYDSCLFTRVVALTGVVLMGDGLFATQTDLPHVIAAVLSFGGVGVSALVVASVVRGPFGCVSAAVGAFELVAFGLFITRQGTTLLSIGGLDR